MTISALEPLARAVFGVTERVTKSARVRRRGPVGLLVVTHAARRDLTTGVRFARRRVTRVAVAVRCEVGRNRKSGASIHRCVVTTGATVRRARGTGVVLRVIELHVERFNETRGKVFQRRIVALRVRVANQAHRDRGRRGLAAMAVGAGFVSRETRPDRVVGAFVTRVARERAMLRAAVEKLGVIGVGALRIGHGRTQTPQT